MKDLLLGLALLSCPGIVFAVFGNSGQGAFTKGGLRSAAYTASDDGRVAFAEACAGCHGRKAEGTGQGPALIQPFYGPEQFADQRFRDAVRAGTPARNWDFGPMPAFPDLPDRQLDQLLGFVREIQRARGVR